jgi:hypothetical protein
VLGAEGGERAEGVGDAQEGGGVVADFEVRGALGDELHMRVSIYSILRTGSEWGYVVLGGVRAWWCVLGEVY